MDRLQAMQTLVRVVEMGSFSAAARELGSTQSAVSKQVASLERQLGADLLVRSTRLLKLTDAGARYVEQARRLVAEVAEAESELREGEHRLQGVLRVACSVCFGRLKLMPLVQDFLAQHPGLKLDLRLNDGFIDLIEQGIDVSLRIGELPDSSLVSRRIASMRRGIYASCSYVERHGEPSEPADLAMHNCLVYSELQTRDTWTLEREDGSGGPISVQVGGNLQTNSGEAIREAVGAGMGLSFAPDWLFEREVAAGSIVRVLPGWASPVAPIQLVSPPQRRTSAKVRAFGDHLAAGLGADRDVNRR
jgi:DNA-binding transcriptional LysR family regulator